MCDVKMSDVQHANLTMMLTIRDSLLRDPIGTASRFGLDADQSNQFTTIGIHQIMAIAANVGDVALFVPRRDLVHLLSLPLPVARTLAVVQPAR